MNVERNWLIPPSSEYQPLRPLHPPASRIPAPFPFPRPNGRPQIPVGWNLPPSLPSTIRLFPSTLRLAQRRILRRVRPGCSGYAAIRPPSSPAKRREIFRPADFPVPVDAISTGERAGRVSWSPSAPREFLERGARRKQGFIKEEGGERGTAEGRKPWTRV